jgi:hypothetical protein
MGVRVAVLYLDEELPSSLPLKVCKENARRNWPG